MKYFLSYASEDLNVAEEIHLGLLGAGYVVFFDKPAISAGENYIARISHEIAESDGFIFLISPDSISKGCYTLTELRSAREKWPHPQKRVLPISVRFVEYAAIPPYLRAISILEPEGNIAAEVVAEVDKWHRRLEPINTAPTVTSWFVTVLSVVLLAIGLGTIFSISYPRVTVDFNIAFLFLLVSAAIVLFGRGIWRMILRSRSR